MHLAGISFSTDLQHAVHSMTLPISKRMPWAYLAPKLTCATLLLTAMLICSPNVVFAKTTLPEQLALSEIKNEQAPSPGAATPPVEPANPGVLVPTPEPVSPAVEPRDTVEPSTENPDQPAGEDAQGGDPARPNVDPNAPIPTVEYDLNKLPLPVKDLHAKLVAAAMEGKVEGLRPMLRTGDDGTQLSLGGVDGDPISFIKSLAGDEGGQEILAILLEVLNAGYVHLSPGTPEELYVWPYFFAVPLDKLTDSQRVELFKLVTAGDYDDMKSFGSYIFYRVGISPDGQWRFFLAGE